MPTFIFNCKRCKIGKRVEYPIERARGYFYRLDSNGVEQPAGVWVNCAGGGRPTEYGGDVEMGLCPGCHKAMDYNRLVACVSPDHKCDARCVHARGANCECSCGGANHGKGWS
jgi:hypothetical protein